MDRGWQRLWLGVGMGALLSGGAAADQAPGGPDSAAKISAQLLGSTAVDVASDLHAPRPAAQLADTGEGGEGGEGGEASATVAPGDDAGLYLQLMLMRGHMRVALQLMDAGALDAAAQHLAHPASEHLPAVEDALSARGVEDLFGPIDAMATAAAQGDEAGARAGYDKVLGLIERAAGTIGAAKRESPEFVVPVALGMLRQAAHEYDEAVRDGAFVNVEEYQDARGFVWEARELLGGIAGSVRSAEPGTMAKALDAFDRLMAFWPSAQPPAAPVGPPARVYGIVAELEFVLSGFGSSAPAAGGEGGEGGEGH